MKILEFAITLLLSSFIVLSTYYIFSHIESFYNRNIDMFKSKIEYYDILLELKDIYSLKQFNLEYYKVEDISRSNIICKNESLIIGEIYSIVVQNISFCNILKDTSFSLIYEKGFISLK